VSARTIIFVKDVVRKSVGVFWKFKIFIFELFRIAGKILLILRNNRNYEMEIWLASKRKNKAMLKN